jgi:hypothetical protein
MMNDYIVINLQGQVEEAQLLQQFLNTCVSFVAVVLVRKPLTVIENGVNNTMPSSSSSL